MKSYVKVLVVLSVTSVLAAKPNETIKSDKSNADLKPKREALVSGGVGYHGPSYKYLPPSSSASLTGFDNYNSGYHGSLFSNLGPKVQTFIVQTESTHPDRIAPPNLKGSYSYSNAHEINEPHRIVGSQGFGFSHDFGGSHDTGNLNHEHGYRYSVPSPTFSGRHQGAHNIHYEPGYSTSHNDLGAKHTHNHGLLHRVKAIVTPANSHFGGGHPRFEDQSSGNSYSKGIGSGSHYAENVEASYFTGNSDKNSGILTSGHNAEHLVGIDAVGREELHNYEHGHEFSTQPLKEQFRTQGSYSYEAPVSAPGFSPPYTYNPPSHNYATPPSIQNSLHQSAHQPPSYAAGHKGLGHFGFTASKAQALNTHFTSSNKYESSYGSDPSTSHIHNASKAPFKPSLFLGTSYESESSGSSGSSHGVPSAEYDSPAQNFNQFLSPPTSSGYEYPPPSALYGAPTQSHATTDDAASVHEPNASYLPSAHQTSYGPVTPNDNYLPPHH